jgi:hypothetical protein
VDAPFDQLTKGFLALARKAGILNADEPYM